MERRATSQPGHDCLPTEPGHPGEDAASSRALVVGREGEIVPARVDEAEEPAAARGPWVAAFRPRRRRVAGAVAIVGVAAAIAVSIAVLGEGTPSTAPVDAASLLLPDTERGETAPAKPPASAAADEGGGPVATPAPAITLPKSGKLWRGDRGPMVERLQRRLIALGLDPGPADARFGRLTQAAVVEFQQSQGLAPDGVVGARTLAALDRAIRAERS